MSFFIVYEFSYKFASLTAFQYVCAPKIKKITARQSWAETYSTPCKFSETKSLTLTKQDAQLSQINRAAECVIVLAKSGRLEMVDNI